MATTMVPRLLLFLYLTCARHTDYAFQYIFKVRAATLPSRSAAKFAKFEMDILSKL